MCEANTSEDGWTPSEKRGPQNVHDFSGWQLSGVACPAGPMTIPSLSFLHYFYTYLPFFYTLFYVIR